jgi:hypothetical protein
MASLPAEVFCRKNYSMADDAEGTAYKGIGYSSMLPLDLVISLV